MNEVKRILNFWKEVNLLTPVTVKSIAFKNQESLSAKDVLKVPYNRIEESLLLNNDKKYEVEIGFGDIKNTYLYEKGNIEKEDFVDGDGGESFIFAFITSFPKLLYEPPKLLLVIPLNLCALTLSTNLLA